ncbi:MAG TPA: DNA-binding protein WhiA [Candidatus Dormibacteraeota bacterium]|nr:DNA-binding protein WhiA [Candidatus Dormibacteraeota bacterium]
MAVKPSFTDEVKAELANVQPARPCCQAAELAAIVEALLGSSGGEPLTLRIPRNAVARKVVHLAKVAGGRVEMVRKGATEKRPSYRLRLTLPPGRGSDDACCARAILRGAFLARGLLGNPADAYHLELALPEAGGLMTVAAARTGIPLKRTVRRHRTVYYLKGAEPISRMLGLMGANRAVMRFENDRILRDMRSQANRRANSETANLDKRLRAALQQRDAVRRLKARDARLQTLAPALREIAELRWAHPRAGLRELAELAQVSKSAVANRLRRLVEQANRNGLID